MGGEKERTYNKFNPYMASIPGFEPGQLVGGKSSSHPTAP